MTALLSLLGQLLHIALMLATAPLLVGLLHTAEARLTGRTGADPWQPWRDLTRLCRKQPAQAESASAFLRVAPPVCLASTAIAAALVPSFTLGMTFAPLSDLLVLVGLLALSRVTLALAALDGGTALGGLAAARVASIGCLAEPALFLVILTLGLLGGTTNLDLLIGLQREGMLQPAAASALAAAALATVALADRGPADQRTEFSAADLALIELSDALRLLVWCDVIGGLFLPIGIAEQGAGLLGWAVGLIAWAAKLSVMVAGIAALRATLGIQRPRRMPELLGVAAVLGLLAALLVLASAAAA